MDLDDISDELLVELSGFQSQNLRGFLRVSRIAGVVLLLQGRA